MGSRGTRSAADLERLAEEKERFLKYFEDVPVQKYAAMYIGRSEQTIVNWLREDNEFFNNVQEKRALWVKKQALKAKAEFKLERLEKEVWKESIEQTIVMPTPLLQGIESQEVKKINGVQTNDSIEETSQLEEQD